MGLTSIIYNAPLIKKVYIPKFIFPLSRVASSFVTMSFSMAAILLVMLVTRSPLHWTILLFWVPLVFELLFCCGIALLLAALTVYFRDMQHLFSVLTLGWMYATPIFYPAGTAARRGAAADEAEPHVPLHQHVPQLCDVRQHPRPQHLDRLRGVRVRHAGHRAGGVPQTAAELYPVYLREGKQWNSRPCPWWK